jgi:alpha-D-xyloside xylohydrolase
VRPAALALAAAATVLAPGVARANESLSSGPLSVTVRADPWRVEFHGPRAVALRESRALALGYRTAAGWARALRATELRRTASGLVATVATSDGGAMRVTFARAGSGVLSLRAAAAEPSLAPDAFGIGFELRPGERFFGFGSRSDAVDHRGREVENYVADGPTREEDRQYQRAFVPPWAHGERDDSTYYPVPWALSSRGYGVLIDRDETSRFRLGSERRDAWDLEVDAPALALRVFAGPRPADALRRFTAATGRQPPPPAPWSFGPWFQTGQSNRVELAEEAAMVRAQRRADVPVSAAETQMHFLPCGAHRDDPAYNAARTRAFHAAGLAHLVYFNPSLCTSYQPVWSDAAARGLLIREKNGQPHVYPAFVGGGGPAGFTTEPLSQFDFTAPGIDPFYGGLLREAVAGGHDGWMEDFGEGVPPTGVAHDGSTGSALHNRYPTMYHCAVRRMAARLGRPLNRHQRSGWTGAARCAADVWGGDPTTVWGFDGLQSAVRQALGIGMSGVSRFGTDIGGYNSYGPGEQLTPELLARWIEFGAVSGVMRTKASGLAFPSYDRPQVFDPGVLPLWRRYTKLHTQLYPYIRAADRRYRRSGLPVARHLALAFSRDARALAVDDAFLFGPDLLAAPVVGPALRKRGVYLPRGRWVDWWRSVHYRGRGDGSFHLRRARVLRGGRTVSLPAPLRELPLLARAGAVIPLLSADVDTLAPYGRGGLVHLSQRRGRLSLLAFPRGRTRRTMFDGESLVSRELRGGGWRLRIAGKLRRTYSIEASLASLKRRFTPCRVNGSGVRGWSYDRRRRVLRIRAVLRRGALTARVCN